MAFADFAPARLAPAGGPAILRRVAGHRAGLAGWFARRRAVRSALAELEALSDRDLADVGLTRADVPRVAASAARLV